MTTKYGLFLVFVLGLMCSSVAFAQDFDDEETERLQQFVVEKTLEELQAVFRANAERKIDDLERFTGLESGKLLKSKILAKKAYGELYDQFSKQLVPAVERSVGRALGRISGSTLSINGQKFVLEGEETGVPFMHLFLDFSRLHARWLLRSRVGSSSTSMGDPRLPFRIENDASWRKSISSISDEQLQEYEKFVTERGKECVESAALSILVMELKLSSDQREEMRKFLVGKIPFDSNFPVIENTWKVLGDAEFFQVKPEFLSDSQKRKWSLLKFGNQLRRP